MSFKAISGFSRCLVGLSALVLVSACSASCPSACKTDIVIGDDRNSTHALALTDTAEAFVDGRTQRRTAKAARAAGTKASGFILIDPDALGPGSDTVWQVTKNRSIALSHRQEAPLGRRVQGYGAMTLALGETVYHLPDGMGVLTDPAQITMQSLTLQPEVGVARSWALFGVQIKTGVGLGTQISVTDTSVQSALLDVHHRSTRSLPYAALRLNMAPKALPLAAEVEARIARNGMSQVRADLHLPL